MIHDNTVGLLFGAVICDYERYLNAATTSSATRRSSTGPPAYVAKSATTVSREPSTFSVVVVQ